MPQHKHIGMGQGWLCLATNHITGIVWDNTHMNIGDENTCPHCCTFREFMKLGNLKGMIGKGRAEDVTPLIEESSHNV